MSNNGSGMDDLPEIIGALGVANTLAEAQAAEAARSARLAGELAAERARMEREADKAEFRSWERESDLKRELENNKMLLERWRRHAEEKGDLIEKVFAEKKELEEKYVALERRLAEVKQEKIVAAKRVKYSKAEVKVLKAVVASLLGDVDERFVARNQKLFDISQRAKGTISSEGLEVLAELADTVVETFENGDFSSGPIGNDSSAAADMALIERIEKIANEIPPLPEDEGGLFAPLLKAERASKEADLLFSKEKVTYYLRTIRSR